MLNRQMRPRWLRPAPQTRHPSTCVSRITKFAAEPTFVVVSIQAPGHADYSSLRSPTEQWIPLRIFRITAALATLLWVHARRQEAISASSRTVQPRGVGDVRPA